MNDGFAQVTLTFDDGPDPVWTPLVLDVLAEAGARATFFVVAPLAARHPSLLSRMRREGHTVAFHCKEHVRHDVMTAEEIQADIEYGLGVLGQSTRYWWTPWGVVTSATEEVARERGLMLVGWTADTRDWRGGPPDVMLARVERDTLPGAIALMHDGVGPGATRDGCARTVELVNPLVSLARSRGLDPVPLGEFHHPVPDRNPDDSVTRTGQERPRRV